MISKNYLVKNVLKANVTDSNGLLKEDVIVKLDLISSWKEGDIVLNHLSVVALDVSDLSNNFKNISDIEENDLIDWAISSLGEERINRLEESLDKKFKHLKENQEKPKPIIENVSVFNYIKSHVEENVQDDSIAE